MGLRAQSVGRPISSNTRNQAGATSEKCPWSRGTTGNCHLISMFTFERSRPAIAQLFQLAQSLSPEALQISSVLGAPSQLINLGNPRHPHKAEAAHMLTGPGYRGRPSHCHIGDRGDQHGIPKESSSRQRRSWPLHGKL